MSKHVTELLNAYLDNELSGSRLRQVEDHLVECEVCRAELEALESLSNVLREVPDPEFTSPERLAARVSLRLPPSKPTTYRRRALEIGWWMIPVGLLAVWIFLNTSFLVGDLLSAASRFGLLTGVSNWIGFGAASWSGTLEQIGVLNGNMLDIAVSTETFTRTLLPQIILQVSIALLYLSWIAIWWARHRRQELGQLLES